MNHILVKIVKTLKIDHRCFFQRLAPSNTYGTADGVISSFKRNDSMYLQMSKLQKIDNLANQQPSAVRLVMMLNI